MTGNKREHKLDQDNVELRLSQIKLARRVVNQELVDYQKLFKQIMEQASIPDAPTLWTMDKSASTGNECVKSSVVNAIGVFQRICSSIREHAAALKLIIDNDAEILRLPAWAAARSILEGILMSIWMLDVEASENARLARALSLQPSVIEGSIKTISKFPQVTSTDEQLAKMRENRQKIINYYRQHKIEVVMTYDKNKKIHKEDISAVVFKGNKATINHNISDLAQRYLPDDHHLYALLSGAVHSKPWLLAGVSNDISEIFHSIVAPMLPVSDVYTKTLCTYFGIDPSWYVRRRATRVQALAIKRHELNPSVPDSKSTVFGELEVSLALHELMA